MKDTSTKLLQLLYLRQINSLVGFACAFYHDDYQENYKTNIAIGYLHSLLCNDGDEYHEW